MKTATLIAIAALIVPLTEADAQAVYTSPLGVPIYDSAGQQADETFCFQAGAFEVGYDPSEHPAEDWAAHWTTAAQTHLNPSTGVFSGKADIEDNTAPFTVSNRAYIMGFSTSASGETLLISNPEWMWPQISELTFPVYWSASIATDVLAGTLDRTESGDLSAIRFANSGTTANPVTAWLATHFPAAEPGDAEQILSDDTDGDGTRNLTEYALGTDPNAPDSGFSVEVVTHGGKRYLQLTASRNPAARATITVATSTDLITWISNNEGVSIVSETATELVARAQSPLGEHDALYLTIETAMP